jgi:hypothetical protein
VPVAELPGISVWYDERGQGDPCVLLHPGGAGIDSRALDPTLDGLALVFRCYTSRAGGKPNLAAKSGPPANTVIRAIPVGVTVRTPSP